MPSEPGPSASEQLVLGPDDSDFVDSEVDAKEEKEQAEVDGGLELASDGLTTHETKTEVRSSRHMKKNRMKHALIPISHRLSFTYFSFPAPQPSVLNNASDPYFGKKEGETQQEFHFFTIDDDLVYLSFYQDWGPLNVAMFFRFCLHVHQMLLDPFLPNKHLVLYTSSDSHQKANAALLAALYAMIIEKIEPADAFHLFAELEFKPFRDAGYGRSDFHLSIQDVLYGMHRALSCNLLDLTTFNLDEYEHYEQVANGDWNWITPNFIAFASPNDRDYVAALRANGGRASASPEKGGRLRRPLSPTFTNTIRYFRERGVKLVVRLNNPLYDKAVFEEAGIEHVDMYFDDGSNPSEAILRDFIARADAVVRAGGVVAVHCKAGLGRTGVLIGAYLTWAHGFTAHEVIGFMRMMRPGCVVGPQQTFMYQNFVEWVRWGVQDAARREAREEVAAELAAARAALPSSSSSSSPTSSPKPRTSLKRPATPTRGGKGEGGEEELPVTPRAKKVPHLAPKSPPMGSRTAPAVKPTPCVGQPRKSPSPSRKRPAAPATVSRMGSDHASGSSSHGLGRGAGLGPGVRAAYLERSTTPSTPPSSSRRPDADPRSGSGSPGSVLMEAQRINVQSSDSGWGPVNNSKPKMSTLPRAHGHERSRSAIVVSGSGTGVADPEYCNSTDTAAQAATFASHKIAASPDVKTKYNLRDATRLPQLRRPASPTLVSVGTDDAKDAKAEKEVEKGIKELSDADVLGVLPPVTSEEKEKSSINTTLAASPAKRRPLPIPTSKVAAPDLKSAPTRAVRVPSSGTTTTTGDRAPSATLSNARTLLTRTTKLASAKSTQDIRRAARTETASSGASGPTSGAARTTTSSTRTVSGASNGRAAPSSSATSSISATSAGSRLGLKRARVASPEMRGVAFPPPSTAAGGVLLPRAGRNVRRRRSSLGEADVQA